MPTKKVKSCQNNPENSYTEKKVKHKPSGYAWCSICSFDTTKNGLYFYRGKDKEIPVVFHNGSTYDYHFIIKLLAEEFKGEIECLGENTEKYITFQCHLKKKTAK